MTNSVDDSQSEIHSECPDPNTLGAYLDDTLSEEKKRFVDNHIEMCQECRLAIQVGKRDQQKHEDLVLSQTPDNTLDQLCNKLIPFSQFSPGKTIGRYITVKPLGLGGMSEVYSAYDPELDRRIALKLMRTDVYADSRIESNVTRLMKEAKAMAQLSHPNVISVYDVIKVDGQVVIAMEYISGGTLRSWLQAEPRSWQEIVDKFVLAGQGLAAAHAAKLVHRDFKPANVLVENDGQVCVTDFGLVRGLDQEEDLKPTKFPAFNIRWDESLTNTGAYIGTPAYMSPEQLLGEKSDTRSDQFCFCVALFASLYGQRPFSGESPEELKESVLSGEIVPIDSTKEVPAWLYDIVKKGLEVKPEDRYPSMEELLGKLRYNPEEAERKRRALRNRRLGLITVILLAAILPVGVWYGMRYKAAQLCKSAEQEFVGVWDEAIKQSIKKAFLATEKPYAQGTWERVERKFDRYRDDWLLMRSDVCEAKHIHGTQSEELFDLRMSCLKNRKQELEAMLFVFVEADPKVVEKAVLASSSLTNVDICADEKALHAPYPPPKTKEAKNKVASIRERLTEVEALYKTGKYQKGLELVRTLDRPAKAVGYKPVIAEVLLWTGRHLQETGDYKGSENTLQAAAHAAAKSKNSLLVAEVLALLVGVIGYRQARHEEGINLGRSAELMLDVAGGDEETQTFLFNRLGIVFYNKGEYDKALQYHRKALAIDEKTFGTADPRIADSLNNIGVILLQQGEYDKALEFLRKALAISKKALGSEHPRLADYFNNLGLVFEAKKEYDNAIEHYRKALAIDKKVLGPEHPFLAHSWNNIGLVLIEQGKYDKALEFLRKALALREKVLGSEHPLSASSLSGIGYAYLNHGRPQQAIGPLERVFSICQKKKCTPGPHGRGLYSLARALVATNKDTKRATMLAKQARMVFGKIPKVFKRELKEVDSWLKKHSVSEEKPKATR